MVNDLGPTSPSDSGSISGLVAGRGFVGNSACSEIAVSTLAARIVDVLAAGWSPGRGQSRRV
jgi:hypothetical protein